MFNYKSLNPIVVRAWEAVSNLGGKRAANSQRMSDPIREVLTDGITLAIVNATSSISLSDYFKLTDVNKSRLPIIISADRAFAGLGFARTFSPGQRPMLTEVLDACRLPGIQPTASVSQIKYDLSQTDENVIRQFASYVENNPEAYPYLESEGNDITYHPDFIANTGVSGRVVRVAGEAGAGGAKSDVFGANGTIQKALEANGYALGDKLPGIYSDKAQATVDAIVDTSEADAVEKRNQDATAIVGEVNTPRRVGGAFVPRELSSTSQRGYLTVKYFADGIVSRLQGWFAKEMTPLASTRVTIGQDVAPAAIGLAEVIEGSVHPDHGQDFLAILLLDIAVRRKQGQIPYDEFDSLVSSLSQDLAVHSDEVKSVIDEAVNKIFAIIYH